MDNRLYLRRTDDHSQVGIIATTDDEIADNIWSLRLENLEEMLGDDWELFSQHDPRAREAEKVIAPLFVTHAELASRLEIHMRDILDLANQMRALTGQVGSIERRLGYKNLENQYPQHEQVISKQPRYDVETLETLLTPGREAARKAIVGPLRRPLPIGTQVCFPNGTVEKITTEAEYVVKP
jgi:plasmid maintenance system antidote protein VapI